MVPYTNCTGAVILLKDNSLEENGTRELFPLSPTFINTSIVNCVDTWFLSNPYLGLPSKEVLISISNNFISKRIEREENSRELVTQLKSKLRSKSSSSESKSSKHQRMQGMSWTRWRLMELNAKKKAKKCIPDETYNTETENHITACRRLEFAFEEDLQKFVEQKYMELLNGVDLNHSGINHLIASIANFYQDNSQNSFDNSVVLSKIIEDVQTIREKWKDSPKANIIHNVLLQVHLLLECVAHGIKCKDYIKMIVFFLRFLTFEESTVFVRDHLNKVIMPKFKSLILETIQEVYEDLMIEPPSEFGDVDDVSPVNSVMLSPSSISNYSNSSSIPSLCSEKKLVKRFPSTAGDCTKKVIAVHSKSTKKKKKIDEDPKVKRNLFEKKTISTPRRNKMRDKSCVPDTPEAKQINDLIWKKQDRDRRHSQVDKSMAPIEESPLKEKSSPLKCVRKLHRSNSFNVRSSPRKFYKLQRHPTMMIGVNRLNQNPKTPTKSYFEDRSVNCVKHPFSSSKKSKSTPESEIKRRRKSLLFSNFTDVKEAKTHSESEVLLSREGSISAVEEREACGSTRRNIFARRILSDASDINSIPCSGDFPSRRIFSDTSDINSIPCSGGFPSRRILSDASDINSIPCSGGFPSRRIFSDTSDPSLSFSSIIDQSECFETNEDGHKSGSLKRKQSTTYLDRKKICRSPHNDNFNNFCDENAIFFTKYKDVDETFHSLTLKQNGKKVSKNPLHVLTETTVDWLEKIETDEVATPRSLTFQEAFAKLTPEQCKSSPTLVKAGDDIITVSPCLSASSIQCLEKAPIISPYRPNIKSKKRGRFAGQP